MDVDASVLRHIKDSRGQNLPEGRHDCNVEVIFFQFFYRFRFPDLLRLKDRDIMLYGPGLHIGNRDLPAAAVHPVRLGHNKDDFMLLSHPLQNGCREVRRPHETNSHIS